MRRTLILIALISASGCSYIRSNKPDPYDPGATWMIKETVGWEQIYYCTSPARGPVRCLEARTP